MVADADSYSQEPRFVDQLAVELVVSEHRYMKLTIPERRHAVHRMTKEQGLNADKVADILRITPRTVSRILSIDPPPILDVDMDGNYVTEDGQVLHRAVDCPICNTPVYGNTGMCKWHRELVRREERSTVSVG